MKLDLKWFGSYQFNGMVLLALVQLLYFSLYIDGYVYLLKASIGLRKKEEKKKWKWLI